MADVVDVGLLPNDGQGDKLRTGGQKLNAKFVVVDAAVALNTAKVTNATHTGDATGSGALTLATVNLAPGTYYNATVTVDAKGRATVVATGNHTGDVTGSQALTLANTGVVAGVYTNASITVDVKGRITAAANGVTTLSATLITNSTTNIVVGDAATDRVIIVNYGLYRDYGLLDKRYQEGEIRILNKGTALGEPSWDYYGDDVELLIAVDFLVTDIRLKMTVANASASDIDFRYNVLTITI